MLTQPANQPLIVAITSDSRIFSLWLPVPVGSTKGITRNKSAQSHPTDIGSDAEVYVVLEPDKLFRTKPESLDKIRDENDSLFGLVQDYEQLFLDLPLVPGKKYGGIEQIFRTDNMYCWFVDQIEASSVDPIAGCPLRGPQPEFVLVYRTLPDHMEIRMVPGLGITFFKYVHHGSITESVTQLIHYYPGAWPENEKQD